MGHYTDAQATVSGGNENTQFLINGSYHKETAVIPGDFADRKGSVRANISNTSDNKKFKIQLSTAYLYDNNEIPSTDLTFVATQLAPNAPALYNADGILNWAPVLSGTSTVSSWTNPLAYLNNTYGNKVNNLISNGVISYQLLPGLEIKSNLGYTFTQSIETNLIPLSSVRPEQVSTSNRISYFGYTTGNSWIIEPQISYTRTIAKAKLSALLGSSFQENNMQSEQKYGLGFNSDLAMQNIAAASSVTEQSNIASTYKYNALFGRVNYNWDDRYIIDVTARRDGSSRFGANNSFQDFWSAGAGWIFTSEKWSSGFLPVLSYGKLRASYGTTGNDQIGDYGYLNTFTPLTVGVPYQGIVAINPNKLSNPDLQWEVTKKFQAGIDLGFFKDQLLFNLNYYNNRSSNLLLITNLSAVTGLTSITQNFPGLVENSGWEIGLSFTNSKKSKVAWNSGFTLTIPRNKLVSLPNIANTRYANTYVVGKSILGQKAYTYLGIDPATGSYVYADAQGNPTPTPSFTTDQGSFTDFTPSLYGGWQNTISYKGVELSISLQYARQKTVALYGANPGRFGGTQDIGNQPASVLQHWQQPGDNTTYPRVSTTYPGNLGTAFLNFGTSSGAVTDGSYIRLGNASLAWNLPESWIAKSKLRSVKIYALGQNLLMITKFKGYDPTANNTNATLPPLRVITAGAQIGF